MWLPRNSHRRTILCVIAACILTLCAAGRVAAQSDPVFDAKGIQPDRPYLSLLPFENIDPLTGSVVLRWVDLDLPGNAGLDVRIERYYNSKGGDITTLPLLGLGGIPMVVFDPGDLVSPEDNHSLPRIYTIDGALHATTNTVRFVYGEVSTREYWLYNRDTHVLRMPNGWVCTFGFAPRGEVSPPEWHGGYLTEVHDPFGNSIVIDWSWGSGSSPHMDRVRQDLGSGQVREVTFTYGSRDELLTMTYSGRTWIYSYTPAEPAPALGRVQPPEGGPWLFESITGGFSVSTPAGGKVSYTFDQIEFFYQQEGIDTHTMSTALKTRTAEPGGGGSPSGTWSFNYGGMAGADTTVNDPVGRTIVFHYNPDLLLETTSISSGGALVERETRSYVWRGYTDWYGPVPLLSERRIERPQEGRTFRTTYEYTPNSYYFADYGQPYKVDETGEISRVTLFTYRHEFGADRYIRGKVTGVTVTVNGESFSSSRDYDDNGFRTRETIYGITKTYTPTGRGNIASESDAHPHAPTEYGYSWGAVSRIQTPGYTVTRSVNPDGTVASETRRGSTTTFQYDGLGRETFRQPPLGHPITTEYGDATTTVRRGTTVTVTTFDGFGRPVGTSDAANVQTKTGYDVVGRKVFESDPAYGAPSDDRRTSYAYDALDRVRRNTHAADDTAVTFDFVGNTVDIGDENGHHTVQTFKAFGSPESGRLMSVRDANGKTTSYTYNALGKLTSVTPSQGNGRAWSYNGRNELVGETHPESGAITYGYDTAGLLESRQDGRGLTIYRYDGNHRLTQIDRPGTAYDASFSYDESDNRRTAANGYVSSTFGYDAANRLTSRKDVVAGYTFDTQIDYTSNDSVELIRYPSGRIVVYSYDNANRISEVQQESEVVASGFAYHPTGALQSYRAGNGLTHTVEYDQRNRPWIVNAGGVFNSTYEYYGNSNVRKITDNTDRGRTQWFSYDPLDRLESFGGYTGGSYTYDDLGNRTSKTSGSSSTTYAYDAATNRLSSTSGMEPASFGYDSVGNTTADGAGTYSYTPANQLETAVVGGVATTYRYDADEVRKVKEASSGKRFYLHATGLNVLTEWSLNADKLQLERDYVYAGQRLIASMRSVPAGGPPEPVDQTPDQFVFPRTKGAALGSVVTSDIVQITGFNVGLAVTVSGAGDYRICGNNTCLAATPFTRGTLTIRSGDYLQLRATAAMTEGTTVKTTVSINGVSATWRLRSIGDPCGNSPEPGDDCDDGSYFAGYSPDGNAKMFTTPADAGGYQFAWPEQVDHGYWDWNAGKTNTYGEAQYPEYVAPTYCANLVVYGKSDWYLPAANEMNVMRLNAADIGGFNMAAEYWTSTEWLSSDGTAWGFYHRMADGFTGYTTKGISMPIRCVRRDMNSNEFKFVDRTRIPVNTVVYSNILLITSLSSPNYVSVTGNDGAFRICTDATCSTDPPFTTDRTRIAEGQYLQLRQTSGPNLLSVTTVSVTMGTLTDTWTVRTVGEPCTGSAPVGTVCDDGSVFAGYSPDGNVRMFTTPADAGEYQFASPEDVDHGYSNWTTGKANTYGEAQYPQYQAPTYCANLVAYEKSDWYLPAPYEMNVLRLNAAAIGGFDMSRAYWTSAENGTVWAIYHRMDDGFSGYTTKGVFMPIRCVRRDMNAAEFTFVDRTGVAANTVVYSNVVQVSGMGSAAAISVAGGGGAYRVCTDGGCAANPAFISTASTIAEGQFVQLRLTSSTGFSSTVSTTVTVGGLSDTWSVTTLAQDTTPDGFTFTDRAGVARSSLVSSNILVISGITGNVPVSIGGGGAYRVCVDASCSTQPPFVSGASSIANGQYLQLQITSSAAEATTTSTTVTVGTVSDTWSVTTAGDPCNGSPNPGVSCEDGSKFAGYSPDGNVKMYTTPADAAGLQFAWPEQVDHGYYDWTTGKANTYGLAQYPEYIAPTYCANLVAYGKSDWYLPAPYEMNVLRLNAAAIGGFNMGAAYWTSAENGTVWAIYERMSDGFNGYTTKGVSMPLRCVRRAMKPSEFVFRDETGLTLSTVTNSDTLQVSGLGSAAPVSISGNGGSYRVCSDSTCSANPPFITTASTIGEGQFLQLRLTTSAAFSTAVSTTITAGGYSDTWSVTTAAQDVTPNAFSFADQVGAPLSTERFSNILQITGITGNVTTSISGGGGAYRVCADASCSTGPAFFSTASWIKNGQYVQLRITSSSANAVTVNTTFTVGSVSDTWSVQTVGDPCAGSPAPGTTCADGTKFAGYSPDGGAKMYALLADGYSQFANPERVDHGYWNWTTGEYNTLGEAQYPEYRAPAYCAGAVEYGKSDWYLPSPAEMSTLRANASAIGNFHMDSVYWTSTEAGNDYAIYTRMNDGFQGYTTKGMWMWIRCVRKDP